ncbi:MAG: rhomboid family intramembrane serine protease [Candidatus Xenobia bacterium]
MDHLEAPPEYWERQNARNFLQKLFAVRPTVTIGLLVACGLMYALTATGNMDDLVQIYGIQINSLISQGQWWRLVSAMFLHAGLVHLAVNGYALWILGAITERIYGHGRVLLIYLVAGLAGDLLTYYFLDPHEASLGASGAIFGLFGAMLVLELQKALPRLLQRPLMKGVLPWILLNLALGFLLPVLNPVFQQLGWIGPQDHILINNYAHIGGLIGGTVTAWLIGPRWQHKQGPDLPALCGWLLLAFCACGLACALNYGFHHDLRFIFKQPF